MLSAKKLHQNQYSHYPSLPHQTCKITENLYLGSVSSYLIQIISIPASCPDSLYQQTEREARAGANSAHPKADQSKIGQDE